MKSRSLYLALACLTLVCARPLTAQEAPKPPADDTMPVRGAVAVRGVAATLGWVPGAYAGGYIAYNTFRHGPCGCDDPGLAETLVGVIVGGAVGSALAAAIPKLNSPCSFAQRFGRSLLGSAIGTFVGMIPITQGSRVATVPFFSIVGATFAEYRC